MRQGAKVTSKFKSNVVAFRESHVTALTLLSTMTSLADVSSILGEYMLKGWVFICFFYVLSISLQRCSVGLDRPVLPHPRLFSPHHAVS